ncbi:MAG: MFS transporter [Waterburya sp.]
MFTNELAFKLYRSPLELAQYGIVERDLTPEASSLLFSGPKFLVALLAGVLMAFAFQLLLTNFTVAVGIPILASDDDDDDDQPDTLGGKVRKTEAKIGLWALITGSIALFAASYLAVKLSLIESPLLGVIIGVVIWAAYFSLIMWLGSSAVGSLIGSLVSTATSGLQGLMGAATGAIGANVARKSAIATAEDITAAVREELTAGLTPEKLNQTLATSLSSLQLPSLNIPEIRSQFEKLLGDVDLETLGDPNLLKSINRETLVDFIGSRTNLSKKDLDQVGEQLESVWQQVLNRQNPTEKIITLIKETNPEELNTEKLNERIQELVAAGTSGNGKSNGVVRQVIQAGIGTAVPAVMERVNLSDVDIDKITSQLQQLKGKAQQVDVEQITHKLEELRDKTAEKVTAIAPASSSKTIQADIEDYILNSLPWQFNHRNLINEFKEVIYDPNANAGGVSKQLQQLNKEYFVYLLKRRGDFSPSRIGNIAKDMEQIRIEVLETVQNVDSEETSQDLRGRIENYLRSTGKEELNPDTIGQDFSTLLEDPNAGLEELQKRFSQFDRDTLVQLLNQRDDISEEEANNIVGQLEHTRENVLNRARELQEQAQAKAQEVRQRVEDYLRNTQKEELNPDAIERELQTLLEDPQAGFKALQTRVSQFDRDTLVQLLSQREDLSEEQVNQIIDRAESVRDRILQAPQQVAEQAKQRSQATIDLISEYLRNTNLEELNPEGIQQDLTKLLDNPKEGALALRDRLSQVDRETLVKLLSQREDLSEEQVNQTIDQVEEAIQNIVRAPQRLAKRATKKVLDFEANLENYLRNTDKEELNPEGIKRDLQILIQDPRAGLGTLLERASQFDRETLVAVLSQREDISEEEANQIVDRIVSVRDSIQEQFQQIQQKMQSILDSIFGKVRDYLNSLERPELNYESIQQDFAQLFDDPKAGFEALRDRLSQFDRDTVVSVLSSREDISEEQANQIVDRIEQARYSVLHQAQRIQQETENRLNKIKAEAKKQAKDARKAVTDAAWWLFGASFTSLVTSAIAGFVAVNY